MTFMYNVPGHFGAAIVEAFLLTKTFPEYFPQQRPFLWAFIRLIGIHAVAILVYMFIYRGLIDPYFLSPIRHFPEPGVNTNAIAARRRYVSRTLVD